MTCKDIFSDKTVAWFTLGCKLNFAETSTIGKQFAALGIRKARQGEEADYCVVNTCSVTELADRKCRQMIRKIIKLHPNAFVIVTGCYAQLKPEDITAIEGVDLVIGANVKADLISILKQQNAETPEISNDRTTFFPACSADDRTRHFLKVQDGCDCFCSYCTIPMARGRSRNGAIADIVMQATEVARTGGKEIVLTGVNIGDFGKTTGEKFIDLLKALDHVEGIERYRISSIEPDLITDEIVSFVSESKHFMPHFHVPLQSGCDAVLKLMRRRYDTKLFSDIILKIKHLLPDAFIGIDVIAGMRGETEEYFLNSKAFIESLPFSQLHVFTYSERPDTKALTIEPVVPHTVRHERTRQLIELSDSRLNLFYDAYTGKTANVLFEHAQKKGFMYGFTENYIKVEIPYNKALCNTVCSVKMTGWNDTRTVQKAEPNF
ncbi:MAG: tRNA (N(6)-L-threonylcarbamoyladenosine(37)-C(2))-methylthiotransferase MtaB [Tannerella sp.]|jgi:threonylcarbamoyladenosine tRNA methylthiotransferase MtaB|nr:tRNA (N(6)-L-threonylcarbamoyladenosine(37)-C(2))-methylthiotransferase MtaB [Tannerella sp.]